MVDEMRWKSWTCHNPPLQFKRSLAAIKKKPFCSFIYSLRQTDKETEQLGSGEREILKGQMVESLIFYEGWLALVVRARACVCEVAYELQPVWTFTERLF